MKRSVLILFFVAAVAMAAVAGEMARTEHLSLKTDLFPFERQIMVYTPNNYDVNTETDYDVIYVFDSQDRSRFDLVHSLLHYNVQSASEDVMDFIVVGIESPGVPIDEYDYFRNNDFLPVPEHCEMQNPYYGGANKFKRFIKDELMPYINSTYRTSGHSLAIGHSLSASFILDALASDDMFDDYIALSPNFEWDERRFANNFKGYDFTNGTPRYIFISMANESEETGWGKEWRDAWNDVKSFVENTDFPDNITIRTNERPEFSHEQSYLPALLDCLTDYALYRHKSFASTSSVQTVHIELQAPWVEGDLFITGNQDALGNWNPAGVKMSKINDTTYSIELSVHLPAEFKFTQGSWDSQIFPENAVPGNLRISLPGKNRKHYIAN